MSSPSSVSSSAAASSSLGSIFPNPATNPRNMESNRPYLTEEDHVALSTANERYDYNLLQDALFNIVKRRGHNQGWLYSVFSKGIYAAPNPGQTSDFDNAIAWLEIFGEEFLDWLSINKPQSESKYPYASSAKGKSPASPTTGGGGLESDDLSGSTTGAGSSPLFSPPLEHENMPDLGVSER